MSKHEKLLEKIRRRDCDYAIRFDDLRGLLNYLGFSEVISGSHHVFKKAGAGIINLQPTGKEAKGYQVRQVRSVLRQARML